VHLIFKNCEKIHCAVLLVTMLCCLNLYIISPFPSYTDSRWEGAKLWFHFLYFLYICITFSCIFCLCQVNIVATIIHIFPLNIPLVSTINCAYKHISSDSNSKTKRNWKNQNILSQPLLCNFNFYWIILKHFMASPFK
jgi:hypothetical protein